MALKTDELEMDKTINRKGLSKRKFTLLISLLVTIIILLCIIIIVLTTTFHLSSDNENQVSNNNTNESSTIIIELKSNENGPQIPGSSHEMIYRDRWGGRKPLYERPQQTPVKYVIISHTAGSFCPSITACSGLMMQMQFMHVTAGSPDIGYNFLIGGDGNIYVARGWDNHNFHMNLDTIGISYIGNYLFDQLTPDMIGATHDLLEQGVNEGKLDKNYILVGHNQTYNTASPGENVYKQIKFWPHFSSEYLNDIEEQK